MTRLLLSAASLVLALGAVAPGAAQAQDVRRHAVVSHTAAPPLTVNRRSWLDMGTSSYVGTQADYVAESTTLHEPVWSSYLPDRFGRSTLPRQFSLPFQENPRGPESGGIFFDNF